MSDTPQPPGSGDPLSQPWPPYAPYPQLPQPEPWDRPAWPFPGFGFALLLCLLFLLVTQVPAGIFGAVLLIFLLIARGRDLTGLSVDEVLRLPETSAAMMPALALAQFLVIGFSLLMIYFVVGRDWQRKLAVRWPGWGATALTLASVPAFVFLGNFVYARLRDWMGGGAEVGGMVELLGSWPVAIGVLIIGFGPGIGEELWCRAFLGRGLVGRHGVWVGVVLTSFLFGLIHIDPRQGTMAMLMGLWLHYVYLTTRSLWMPMLIHTVNNSLAVAARKTPGLREFETATDASLMAPGAEQAVLVLLSLAVVAAVAWALYQARARLVASDDRPVWQPAAPGVECPPPESGTRVVQGQAPLATLVLVAAALVAFVVYLLRYVPAQ